MQTLATQHEIVRHRLRDGEQTTVYLVRYARYQTRLRVQHFEIPERLEGWCRRFGVQEAIVGGFFVRPHGPPLGELWIDGRRVETEPVSGNYGRARAAICVDEGKISIAPRGELPRRPAGHLLQAGPLLVRSGTALGDRADAEGFVAGAAQFDSDISRGRYPRAALGCGDEDLIALVCDGRRTGIDAGLTLAELAELLVELGAREAINLDGGGSAALVHRGHLLNRPYAAQDRPGRRAVATAVVFDST